MPGNGKPLGLWVKEKYLQEVTKHNHRIHCTYKALKSS